MSYSIEVTDQPSFDDATMGYDTVQNQTVTITNTGTGDITNLQVNLTGVNADQFQLGSLSANTLDDTTTSATFTLRPKTGLPVGEYVASVVIIADHEINESFEVTFTVVSNQVPVTGVTLDQSELNLLEGGASATLTATVAPENATNASVVWTSSDDTVATVVDGVVTPVGEGTAMITVTTVDGGYTASAEVNVAPLSDDADLSNLSLSNVTLSPAFDSETVNYVATVGYDVNDLTVTAVASSAKATISINGQPVTSGQASNPLSLAVGENLMTIVVTAENQSKKEYSVTVTRLQAPAIQVKNATITEAVYNDGTIVETQVVTIERGIFKTNISDTDVTVHNLPSGLGWTMTRDSDTQLTIEFIGQADKHSKEYSTSHASITIAKEYVENAIEDVTSSQFAIEFMNPARITVMEGVINEWDKDGYNTGEISPQEYITVQLENGTFVPASSEWLTGIHIDKLPSGLQVNVERKSDQELKLTFSGSAAEHANVNDVHDAAVVIHSDLIIGADSNLRSNTFKVNFNEPEPYLTLNKTVIEELESNDGSIDDTILVTLNYGIFDEQVVTSDVYGIHLPEGLHVSEVIRNSDVELLVRIEGQTTSHGTEDNVENAVIRVSTDVITPTATSIDTGNPIVISGTLDSPTLAVRFHDSPPSIAVTKSLIQDDLDGSVTETQIVELKNGTFTESVSGVVVNNLPPNIGIDVTRVNDTQLMIAFTGVGTIKNTASTHASVTIPGNMINGAASALTTNSFVLDVPSDASLTYRDKENLLISYTSGDSIAAVTHDVFLPKQGILGSNITWSSSNETVIDVNGHVFRPSSNEENAKVTLTATITNGTAQETKPFTLTVLKQSIVSIPVSGVAIDPTTLQLEAGGTGALLTATVMPSDATNRDVIWTSSDESVAMVELGYVVPVGAGTAIITATTKDGGYTANAEVTVIGLSSNALLTDLTLSHGNLLPSFQPETTNYSASVGNAVRSIQVTATAADEKATVKVNDMMIQSGSASDSIPLQVGANTIVVTVTAEDGTEQSYQVVIDRADKQDNTSPEPVTGTDGEEGEEGEKEEIITVDIQTGAIEDGEIVSQTEVIRRSFDDGTIKDEIIFTHDRVNETVNRLKEQQQQTAIIVVPDEKDEVDEVNVKIPTDSVQALSESETNLEIFTENVTIHVPSSSLEQFNEYLYFDVIPVKEEEERQAIEQRVKTEQLVIQMVNSEDAKVVGRPMTIHTNMQSHRVTLTLPIDDSGVENNQQENWLEDLVVFIEHSDGTKEVVRGKVVPYKSESSFGYQFDIDKFSIFTLVYLDDLDSLPQHLPYINGYEDGTFRPDRPVTRAEFATMLANILNLEKNQTIGERYEVSSSHWAYENIAAVVNAGLMKGYPDGTFQPDQRMTRAEIATVVAQWQKEQLENVQVTHTFEDVRGHWAETSIERLATAGIVSGYPGNIFDPDAPITRAEVVTLLNTVFHRGPLLGVEENRWIDVDDHHWAKGHIDEASIPHQYRETENGEEVIE